MASQKHGLQVEGRPLVDLTNRIDRKKATHIAGGAYGDVYRCSYQESPGSSSLVAVKALRFFESEDPETNWRKLEELNEEILRPELGILRRLEHENIVPLLGVTRNFGPMIAAVFPWMPNGTLHSFLKNMGCTLTIGKRLQMAREIGAGLEYLHSAGVFHGDLHSDNVLIDKEGIARITDFGLARTIEKVQPGLTYLRRSAGSVGAERWAAPERLDGGKAQPSADIYSFGCLMFEIFFGDLPWNGMNTYQVIKLKMNGQNIPGRPIHGAVDDEHWALMVSCWVKPSHRPDASKVVATVSGFITSRSQRCSARGPESENLERDQRDSNEPSKKGARKLGLFKGLSLWNKV